MHHISDLLRPERELSIWPDIASIRESIVKSVKAGLLTCKLCRPSHSALFKQ